MKKYFVLVMAFITSAGVIAGDFDNKRIQPYKGNQSFWQYNGQPVLLVGGSSDDNLFQVENLKEELDLIRSVGGNYVRNTMSCRNLENMTPFEKSGNKYNPDKINKEYWDRLERFLRLTSEREIFVQIEVWAFHDFSGDNWLKNPWNPLNNTVLTEENTKLKIKYHGNTNTYKGPFFFSVPKLNDDKLLVSYQQKFVDKLLLISLKYDNVLYCITNEIFSQYSPEWGWYWADYIKDKAKAAGKNAEVTEMYQKTDIKHGQHQGSFNHPEIFSYFELSQNSFNSDQEHWDQLQWARTQLEDNPRPVNHTKTYGGLFGWWTGGPNHGVERFWRNIIGGAASVRFHRPSHGMGISERAQNHIKSASMLLAKSYDFFTSVPDMNSVLLLERDPDEAYLAKNAKDDIVVYFPDGGEVVLDLSSLPKTYRMRWLNTEAAQWFLEREIKGGGIVRLKAPFVGNWVALFTAEN